MNINLVQKGLVCIVIESTLLKIGKPTYDKVVHDLNKKYHCYLTDCYEHPEYLSEILKELYGDAHDVIIQSIHEQLEEFSYHESIKRFLQVIN